MANINLDVIIADNEICTISVSEDEHKRILEGDQDLLRKIVNKEQEKKSKTTISQLCDISEANTTESLQNSKLIENKTKNNAEKKNDTQKENIFMWPDKAVMLLLELYCEKEQEFTNKQKRHNKLWEEIASELNEFKYEVTGLQVQNKMSSLKRMYKKIKDSNAKSGNNNTSWEFYPIMESLFGEKAWVSPPAVATSEGPANPSTSASCSPYDSSSSRSLSPTNKTKKRKVETILESFISNIKNGKEQMKEKKDQEQLEREEKRAERWELSRKERKEMHKESIEVQKDLINMLSKFLEK